MQNDIKPCPFCGAEAMIRQKSQWYSVECFFCSARVAGRHFEKLEPIAAWNCRTADAERDEARLLVRRCDGVLYDELLENDVRAAITRWDAEK